MPYTTNDTSIDADGKKQLGAELDKLVETGQMTGHDAEVLFQARGGTTGPGDNSYQAPPPPQDAAAVLNEQSRQSAARSAAYQKSREGNPEGYSAESQEEFNSIHPLSEY